MSNIEITSQGSLYHKSHSGKVLTAGAGAAAGYKFYPQITNFLKETSGKIAKELPDDVYQTVKNTVSEKIGKNANLSKAVNDGVNFVKKHPKGVVVAATAIAGYMAGAVIDKIKNASRGHKADKIQLNK